MIHRGAKYYAVAKGFKPGIYRKWSECKEQVYRFPGNRYKSFISYFEALHYIRRFIPSYEEPDTANKIDRYMVKIEKSRNENTEANENK